MSKYTTELRYICEAAAGLKESEGYNNVNAIIAAARPKIFDFSYPIFDEAYRPVLETKILKHFYTQEIGSETVGRWRLMLDATMNEIMPWYNKLYSEGLALINPFLSDDLETTFNRSSSSTEDRHENRSEDKTGRVSEDRSHTYEDNATDTTEYSGENSGTITDDGTTQDSGTEGNSSSSAAKNVRWDKYSDTPQGAVTNLDNDTYLTNARKITDDGTGSTASSTTTFGKKVDNDNTRTISGTDGHEEERTHAGSGESADTGSVESTDSLTGSSSGQTEGATTENYIMRRVGRSGMDIIGILERARNVITDVDMMIIADLQPLFMGLW